MKIIIKSTGDTLHEAFEIINGKEHQIDTWTGTLERFQSKLRGDYSHLRKGVTFQVVRTQPETVDFLVEIEGKHQGTRSWAGHTVKATDADQAQTAALADFQQMGYTAIKVKSVTREGQG